MEGGGEIEEGKEEGQGPRGWSSSPLSPGGPTRWRRQRQRQQQLPQEEEEEGKHEMSSGHVGVAVAVGPMSPPNVHEGFPFAGSQRRQQTGNNHGWGRRLFGPVGAVEESSGGGDRDREVVFSLSEAIPFSASNNSNTRSDSVSLLHLASGGVARGESHSFPHTHRTCSARPTQSLSMGASVSCRSGRDVRVSSTGLPNVVGRLAGGLFSPSSGSGIDLEGDGRGDGGVVEEAAVLSSLLSPRTAAASLGL